MKTEPIAFQTSAFTYSLADLQSLRKCMEHNDSLSATLRAFSSLREWPDGFPWIPYLEFAEKIARDNDWPEKHFERAADSLRGGA